MPCGRGPVDSDVNVDGMCGTNAFINNNYNAMIGGKYGRGGLAGPSSVAKVESLGLRKGQVTQAHDLQMVWHH